MPSPTKRTTSARIRIDNLTQALVDEAVTRGLDLDAVVELAVYQSLDPIHTAAGAPTRTASIYVPVSKQHWDTEWVPAIRSRGLDITGYATLGLYRHLHGHFTPPTATRIIGNEGFRTSLRLPEHLLDAAAERMASRGALPKPARVVAAFIAAAFQTPAEASTE